MHISIEDASERLSKSEKQFIELFKSGTLRVEFYKPNDVDLQKPHDMDEIYLIASGEGAFINNGVSVNFKSGDFLFVKAGIEHRFINFTNDFSTWVFFYGPKVGE